MKKHIILPLEKNPPILAYNSHASYLSILFTIKDYYKYFYSDFINIFSDEMSAISGFIMERWYCNDMFFDMLMLVSNADYVITDCFGENAQGMVTELLRPDNLIKSIKLMLSMGFYVSGKINEFYVPKREAEGRYDNRHDFYLNGYDDDTGCFYLSGYTSDGRYETVDISYENLAKGLNMKSRYNILNFCKIKDFYHFRIEPDKIKMLLDDYIYARCSYEKPSGIFKKNISSFCFGTRVYDRLIENMGLDNFSMNPRIFRMLLEHKKCMLKRFDVLGEAGINIEDSIKNEYKEIVKLQALAFNLTLKYRIKPSKNLIGAIIKHCKDIKDRELDVLQKVALRLN